MNRVFLDTGGDDSPTAALAALKAGRTFASNGPLLGLEVDGKHPGAVIARTGRGIASLPCSTALPGGS